MLAAIFSTVQVEKILHFTVCQTEFLRKDTKDRHDGRPNNNVEKQRAGTEAEVSARVLCLALSISKILIIY